jgi:DNA polymerase III subunit delta'
VADVFDDVLGQERAVSALRHYAHAPVHAYLFTGPAGAGMREALVAFIAALQCPNGGCGTCERCRLVEADSDSDVTFVERAGVNWSVDELAEAERVSRRRPLGGGFQIVVLESIELAVASATKLLKILEEPPQRTVFLLTAESFPESLVTVASRCIEVPFAPLSDDVIADYLMRQGYDVVAARVAAGASGGDLRRARVLARDDALAQRIAAWQSVPEQLNGVSARASELATQLLAAIDAALEPLSAMQSEEMERRTANAKQLGQRSLSGRRELESRFRREQRRFRQDDLRFGLSALTRAYRERLLEGLESIDDGDRRGRVMAEGAIASIGLIDTAYRSLASNVDESLLLTNLLLGLSRC